MIKKIINWLMAKDIEDRTAAYLVSFLRCMFSLLVVLDLIYELLKLIE